MRIAVLRFERLPRFVTWEVPGEDELLADDRRLIAELNARGAEASSVVWRDPSVDWSAFDAAVIHSTWDYIDDLPGYLETLGTIERSGCRLMNPLAAVCWNADKHYLLDLQARGVPIVPTYPGDGPDWRAAAERERWTAAVLKPRVGGGAQAVERVAIEEAPAALERLRASHPDLAFLVQPLVPSIHDEGECSFYFAGGWPTHAILRLPAAGDFRAHAMYGGETRVTQPAPAAWQEALAILARVPFDTDYARLDLVRVGERLVVMEVELIEPIQYFSRVPRAAGRLAGALIERARRGAGRARA